MQALSTVDLLFRSKPAETSTQVRLLLVQEKPEKPLLDQEELNKVQGVQFEVVPVETLEEAVLEVSEGDFDAVLIDLDLPGNQAMDLFHQLKAKAPHLPYILLAGESGPTPALQAIQEGAQDCLFKNQLGTEMLLRTVVNAIECRQYRQQILEMKNFYKAFIDDSAEMLAAIDLDGEILFVNSSFGKVLGYGPRQLDGRAFFSLVDPGEREGLRKKLLKAAEDPEGSWIIARFFDAKHSFHVLEGRIKRFWIDEKESRLLATLRDVTHFMRLGEIFQEYKSELQEAKRTILAQSNAVGQRQDAADADRLTYLDLTGPDTPK